MKEKNQDLPDLNLPDWSNHAPEPKLTALEMIKVCEPLLPYWNKIRFSKPLPMPSQAFVLGDQVKS